MDSFKDVKEFEMHMISGQHNVPTVASSMDHVKQCFVNKMKMSKPNALSTVSSQLMSSKKVHLSILISFVSLLNQDGRYLEEESQIFREAKENLVQTKYLWMERYLARR